MLDLSPYLEFASAFGLLGFIDRAFKPADDARHLGIAIASPLLEITRVASDLNGKPVELRISRCKTTAYRYVAEIT